MCAVFTRCHILNGGELDASAESWEKKDVRRTSDFQALQDVVEINTLQLVVARVDVRAVEINGPDCGRWAAEEAREVERVRLNLSLLGSGYGSRF